MAEGLAEGLGFEPTVERTHNGFETARFAKSVLLLPLTGADSETGVAPPMSPTITPRPPVIDGCYEPAAGTSEIRR